MWGASKPAFCPSCVCEYSRSWNYLEVRLTVEYRVGSGGERPIQGSPDVGIEKLGS